MRYLSVCSGIEAATVAWHPLGWQPVAFSEIDKFPSRVLAHHYPTVPNLGDMTKFKDWPDANVDVLVGGTPCQSFSIAGLRAGLGDPRGNLMLTFGAIAAKYRPRWLVWENVPGVLSSNSGRDFGTFLGMLGQLGYGFAYRVLDAQYFGVAQRRRRVFVVGCLGDWRRAAAVLFERQSLRGDLAPSRGARQAVAGSLAASAGKRGGVSEPDRGGLICMAHGQGGAEIRQDGGAPTLTCNHEAPIVAASLLAGGHANNPLDETLVPVAFSCKDHGADAGPISPTLRAMGHGASHANAGGQVAVCVTGEVFHTLRADGFDASEDGTGRAAGAVAIQSATEFLPQSSRVYSENGLAPQVQTGMHVRRLTPRECERLQGFPDDYTAIPGAKDGPRYKALGNSMAVPVMAWIGRRIAMVSSIMEPT